MYGSGLLKGLGVTFKHWFSKEFTEQYPEQRPDLPPAAHYFFHYIEEKCIACNMCVTACPNKVIELEAEKNESGKRVPTGYVMDLQYCLMCGLCVDVCPTKALLVAPNFETGAYHRENTRFDFFTDVPEKMNEEFDAIQAAYWEKKRPEGNPVGAPKAYVEPKAPKTEKPAAEKAVADGSAPVAKAASTEPTAPVQDTTKEAE